MKNLLPYLLFGTGACFLGVGAVQTDFGFLSTPPSARATVAETEAFELFSSSDANGEEILRRANPRFDASLTDAQLEKMIAAIDRFLKIYATADFDEFVDWRRGDLEFASKTKTADATALRARMVGIMGIPSSAVPSEWIPLTRLYWEKMYASGAPLRGIDLGSCAIFAGESGSHELPHLEEAFEDAKIPHSIHTLAVPHRRSLEEMRGSGVPGIWFTFQARFQFRDAGGGREVLLRFVWDPADQDWFLEGAVSTFNGDKESPYLVL